MGYEFFGAFFPIGGGMAFLAAIALLIGAAQDAKASGSKADVVKHVYFYLTAFITLTIVVFSTVTLVNVGARSWVFTKADEVTNSRGTPPSIYLTSSADTEVKPATANTAKTCSTDCEFSEQDKLDVANWETNYRSWKDSMNLDRDRATATVTALSFLIVAVLAFWFHWRVIQKEEKNRADGHPLVTRAIYFWGMSLFGLLMIVIAGGFLLNVLLRTWLYPNLDSSTTSTPTPVVSEQASIDSLINCASACGFTDEQVQLAEEWKVDYAAATTTTEVSKTAKRQSDIATSLPFVLVGIPLFLYHWLMIRRKTSVPTPPPATGVSA